MKETELLAIGGAYVDINCPDFPFEQGLFPETETVGSSYEMVPGGSAINFALLCSSLEISTTFVGKTGQDAMGKVLADLLRKSGVQPELITDNSVSTNMSFNMANKLGETIMTVAGSANQSLSSEEVYDRISSRLSECSHLYIGGCFKLKTLLPAFEQLIHEAKGTGTKVILDHGRLNASVMNEDKETVKRLARMVDYYLPSTGELQDLWGVESIDAGLRLLAQEAAGVTVVKDGVNGAATMIGGEIVRVPSFNVRPIHTVGAGDSFNAGFIAAQINGLEGIPSIRFGCAVAALKISQSRLPTRGAVEGFIASNSRS